MAFCISTYLNLDSIDGKQARRTGTSSPLGELFDHGCDAINMMVIKQILMMIFFFFFILLLLLLAYGCLDSFHLQFTI
jgi:phosphatidylglycerophosphate synthase